MAKTGKGGFTLNVKSPEGGATLRTFSNKKKQEGIEGGIAASAHPLSGCDTLDFTGVPDLMDLESGDVLHAFVEDGEGIHAVFYGAVVPGHTNEPTAAPVKYQASARVLLLATACRGETIRARDTAIIALDLVTKYRHASLNVRAEDFPPSGTILETFTASGRLAGVLDQLIEQTENPDYGSGLDPMGFCFFKPNALQVEVDYAETDYASQPTSGNTISTATLWRLEKEPGITPWAGAYVPMELNHLSVPDVALHERYGYESIKPIPESALVPVYSEAYSAAGFSDPLNALTKGATTPSARSGTATSTFTVPNEEPTVCGVRLLYRRDDAVGVVLFRATAGGVYYEVELPKSDGAMKPLVLPLPPHESGFVKWDSFKITVPTGGTFELQQFYPLRPDTNRLDATAKPVAPEQRPGQIAQQGIRPNAAGIKLKNAPRGQQDIPSAGIHWGWTPDGGPESVTDLEVSAYDVDSEKTQFVKGYYRKPKS